ncbi:MAG TPA: hypothetical protein VMA98_13440 [Candidatus Acidoferrales bacterium]|nr:hypothetical protein [Candidatus Acidoferrales bacterium]
MLERDPRDPRRRERLAGSYLASLLLHALIATLIFTLASSSSQEGASESVIGGSIVTLEQRAPSVTVAAAPVQQAAPVPNVPKIAPVVHHAPLIQAAHQPTPPQHHELSQFKPTAPPNPTPVPQASPQPNPQPTTPIYEPNPKNELPAVPTAVPSIPTQQVAVRVPPTQAPSPVPSIAPTVQPTVHPPAPTSAPTAKPATPAPTAKPSVAPTAAIVAEKASAAPSTSPKPLAPPSTAPAKQAGVPSPGPTSGPQIAQTKSVQPSPGPEGKGSPSPHQGNEGTSKRAPPGTVHVPPTPAPTAKPTSSAQTTVGRNINNLLNGMLPHNVVNPSQESVHFRVALNQSMEPTPPPRIVAMTKFTYEEKGAGNDALDKMWVIATHRVGPTLVCDGWLVRYPHATGPTAGGPNLIQIGGLTGGLGPPVVDAVAHVTCSERALVPFTPPSPASP